MKNPVLKLLSEGENVVIPAVDGSRILTEKSGIFSTVINNEDEDGKFWFLEPDAPTKETPVQVFEVVEDATFKEMFDAVNPDFEKLVLTQHQIIEFAIKHRRWLRGETFPTLFLAKLSRPYFFRVIQIFIVRNGELSISAGRFDSSFIHRTYAKNRLVAPL